MANGLGAAAYGVRRGLSSFLSVRNNQYQGLRQRRELQAEARRQEQAEQKAMEAAAEKVQDEKSGQMLGEMNKAISSILARPGSYDERGLIRPEVWDGQVEPILGQMSGIKSKNWDGLDYVNSIRLRTAHRMPSPEKAADNPAELFVQKRLAGERAKAESEGRTFDEASEADAVGRAAAEYESIVGSAKQIAEQRGKIQQNYQAAKELGLNDAEAKNYALTGKTKEEMIQKMASDAMRNLTARTQEEAIQQATEQYNRLYGIESFGPPSPPPAQKEAGAAPPQSSSSNWFSDMLKGLWMGQQKGEKPKTPAARQPAAEPDTVVQDVEELAKEKVPEDLGDVPGGIDINAKAEDDPEFQTYEDAAEWARQRFAGKPDSLQRALSGLGRKGLPRKAKK